MILHMDILFPFILTGGTDIMDQRCGYYSIATKNPIWTRKVLALMLDTSRVNAQTIVARNTGENPQKQTLLSLDGLLPLHLLHLK